MKGVGENQNQAVPAVGPQGKSGVQELTMMKEEEGKEKEEEEVEVVEKRRKSGEEAGCPLTWGSPASSTEVNKADGDQMKKKRKKKSQEGENGENICVTPCPDPHLTPDPGAPVQACVAPSVAWPQNTGVSPVCCVESRRRQKEHHSDMDLRRVDSFGQGEATPGHQGLGRSLSEGSCVNPGLTSFPSPSPFGGKINVHMRRQTLGPGVLPGNTPPTAISSHHSFCLGNLRVESDGGGGKAAAGGRPPAEVAFASRTPWEQSGQMDALTGPTAEQIRNRLL